MPLCLEHKLRMAATCLTAHDSSGYKFDTVTEYFTHYLLSLSPPEATVHMKPEVCPVWVEEAAQERPTSPTNPKRYLTTATAIARSSPKRKCIQSKCCRTLQALPSTT